MAAPRIWFAGDPHGEFRRVVRLALRHRPDALIFLGDLELGRPLSTVMRPLVEAGVAVHGIHGNHDADTEFCWENLAADSMYPAFNLDGVVATVAAVRIAGLGGVLRETVWYPPDAPLYRSFEELHERLTDTTRWDPRLKARLHGLRLLHRASIFPDVYERLASLQADVLVSHEAPGGGDLHPHGFEAVSELAQLLGARRGFHGHHHLTCRYAAAGSVQWYGVGYREIVDLDGNKISG